MRRRLLLLAPLAGAIAAIAWVAAAAPAAGAAERLLLLLRATAASATGPLTPQQIHSAYALPDRGAAGQTIAVVSPYDDPYAEADLAAYDKRFGLPACTTDNGCFRRLNAQGKPGPYPGPDASGGRWVAVSALGIEIAHAVCQSCRLLLVEADTDTKRDISAAVAGAAQAGATVVVTAFASTEDPIDSDWAADYQQPNTAIVAAAGDSSLETTYGYTGEPNFPSNLPGVIAVGGTSLRLRRGGGYGGESTWPGTVSGCSLFQPAPPWQAADANAAGCSAHRAVADIAAAATPGALVHITGAGQPGGPWYTAQGTSLAAPIIAGAIGLAGSLGEREAPTLYTRAQSDPGAFHDITTGINAPGCATLICRAGPGWDGPTGLGTPDGLAAFLPSGGALSRGRPGVALRLAHGQLRADRHFAARLTVANANPFAIVGTVALRAVVKLGRRFRTLRLATAKLALAPLATDAVKLAIAGRWRALVRRSGQLRAWVYLTVRGPAGRAVTVKRKVMVLAP